MASDPPSPGSGQEPGGATGSREEEGAPPGWARWVSRLSLAAAVVALGATVWTVGLDQLLEHLRSIGWWFVAILALEVVITMVDARAIFAVSCNRGDRGYGQILFAQIAGRAVNLVTPASTLGEATKASILTERMGTSRAVAAVLFVALASAVIQLSVIAVGAPLTALLLPLPTPLRIALVATAVIAAAIAITLAVLVRRGMLSSLARIAVRLHLVSRRRQGRWQARLERIDNRLSGSEGSGRRAAVGYVVLSKVLTWTSLWLILAATGYYASVGTMAALLSAGVVIGWISALVPMGIGVTESGNYALFRALGEPPAHGVALVVARRMIHLVIAALGFVLLAIWRASSTARTRLRTRTRPKGATHVDTHPRDAARVHDAGRGGA